MKSTHNPNGKMPFLAHLSVLRVCLFRSLIFLIVCFLASYYFRSELLDWLRQPIVEPLTKYTQPIATDSFQCVCEKSDNSTPALQQSKTAEVLLNCHCTPQDSAQLETPMVFLSLPEVFFTKLKLAFLAALFFAFPYFLLEIWWFIKPGLYKQEKKLYFAFAVLTFVCFTGGGIFGYLVVFPFGFDFFLSLTEIGVIIPTLSISQYLSFSAKLLFAFGLVFELPLIALILARLGILTPKWMIENMKYAVLMIFLLSAILTPPDPWTMLLMVIPLLFLYIISIAIAFLAFNHRKAALLKAGITHQNTDD